MDRRNFLETLLTSSAVPAFAGVDPASRARAFGRSAQNDSPGTRDNFNAGWLFARQSRGAGELGSFDRASGEAAKLESRFREAHRIEYNDAEWQPVDLPHTWNAHDVTDERSGYWRGIGWYRKHFTLDAVHSGKRIFLEVEGVNSVSEFWLNDERLREHKGGYTSFELDLTDRTRFGEQGNVLAVKVDNLYHATVPPTVMTDYNFYGGIYRDVWLRVSGPVYVSDVIWTTPVLSTESASLSVEAKIVNKSSEACELAVAHEIPHPDGGVACTLSSLVRITPNGIASSIQSGVVDPPLLWSPDTPNVYRIRDDTSGGRPCYRPT